MESILVKAHEAKGAYTICIEGLKYDCTVKRKA